MSNVPKLRFPEFSDEWKEILLKDAYDINPKSEELPEKFRYIDLEAVQSGLLVNEPSIIERSTAPSRAQRLLQVNDVLFQTVRPYQKNNYIFEKEADCRTVASTGYAQLRSNKNNPLFIYQYIHNNKFVNDVLNRCTGTSYPAINSTDLGKITINIPSLSEQERIADFLSTVDSRIETQEYTIKSLEEMKKGYMQKIFSQEIRFKDENGEDYPEWEEKKLANIVDIEKGKQLSKVDMIDKGNYYVLNGGQAPSGYTDEWNTEEETITISEGGESCGFVNFNTEKFWAGGHCYALLNTKIGVNNKYLYQYLKQYESQIMRLRVGSGLPNIQKKDLNKFLVLIPVQEEQQKIANFLSTIDEKIEVEKEILETLKDIKKGLLQQMFV